MFIDFNNLFRIQIRFIEKKKKEGNKRKDSVDKRKGNLSEDIKMGLEAHFGRLFETVLT